MNAKQLKLLQGIIRSFGGEGHVWVPLNNVRVKGGVQLGLAPAEIDEALRVLAGEGAAAIEGDMIADGKLAGAERMAAADLARIREEAEGVGVAPAGESGDLRGGLAPAQRSAFEEAVKGGVVVITGGPGTGKTYTMRAIVQAYTHAGCTVNLCAPTGKAAKVLAEAAGHPASTIHRLLEWTPSGFKRRRESPLNADLIVADECSMLDTQLAADLFQAIPSGATLLIVGDIDQLPSVGPGQVLADVINSARFPVCRFTQIFRQAEKSKIVIAAHAINHGRPPVGCAGPGSDFYLINAPTPELAAQHAVALCATHIPRDFGLSPMRDVQLLCPMNKGMAGTATLNPRLGSALNPNPKDTLPPSDDRVRFSIGDKVIQTKNNYDHGVMNGEGGVVIGVNRNKVKVTVDFDEGREVTYGDEDLGGEARNGFRFPSQLLHAWALTVHKFQGSQSPAVVVTCLQHHGPLLKRNLLYTAVTRGRKLVVLVGDPTAIARAARTPDTSVRNTKLRERLEAVQGGAA